VFSGDFGGWGRLGATAMSRKQVHQSPHRKRTDPALKAEALRTADEQGVQAASEQTGVPVNTIYGWRQRARKRQELVPSGTTHGAYSPAQIARRAATIRSELFVIAPELAEPRFAGAVDEYLRAVARAHMLDDWIKQTVAEDGAAAVPSRTWEQATAAARLVAKLSRDLGLDPVSAAGLKNSVVDAELGIARLVEEGKRIAAQREARAIDVEVVDD